ncbi:uncharacterized protein PgNI_07166 [Pyricularia grisea]|uniref:Uncharacterized protein n=1 Tax=Pyricularia grisea TaxID=148305 RepID=A0A6P8B2M0_PYRGI|nr:uncharacterized protein PgNI_07166 [Pyricularia grisea]TLD09044.1 hypothetical protein PgNI_07166 [Pyricularia grisea]
MSSLHSSCSDLWVAALLLFLFAATQAAMLTPLRVDPLVSLTDSSSSTARDSPKASPSADEYTAEYAKGPKPKPKAPSVPSPKGISAPADASKSGPGMPVIIYYQPEKLDMRPSVDTYMYGGYRVSCGKYAGGDEGDVMSSAASIRDTKKDVTADPGKCIRVGCRGSSAVYFCNHDKSKSKTVAQSSIGFMANTLSELCCQAAPGGGEAGEIVNEDNNYSVIVGYGDCSKGDRDGPYTEQQARARPICRGKPTPSKNSGPGGSGNVSWRDDASWPAAVIGLGFMLYARRG